MSAKKNYIFTVHEISVDRHLRAMFDLFFLCRPSTHIVQILQKGKVSSRPCLHQLLKFNGKLSFFFTIDISGPLEFLGLLRLNETCALSSSMLRGCLK
jgi:hypothetical protein